MVCVWGWGVILSRVRMYLYNYSMNNKRTQILVVPPINFLSLFARQFIFSVPTPEIHFIVSYARKAPGKTKKVPEI